MAIFEASPEGFRQQNLGRPAEHLVRELLQNVFDEAATKCDVIVHWTPKKGVLVAVVDDVQGGVRDEKLIFTIWLSDKQDLPTKRGRMGRGLKELVSVSDQTIVATQGRKAIVFRRDASGEWSRSETSTIEAPTVGTMVESRVRNWGKKEAENIVRYLKRMRPPVGLTLTVNGETVARKAALEKHAVRLPAPVFTAVGGERREWERAFDTTLELFAEEKTYVYEMGIPIEPIEYPLSVDVGQRVPLRERRDTLTTGFARQLYAALLEARIDVLPPEALRDNHAIRAAENHYDLSNKTKAKLAEAWTNGCAFADSPAKMSAATGQHIPVVNLRSLPEGIREVVRAAGTPVEVVMAERKSINCPVIPQANWTPAQRRTAALFVWIAAGIKRPCTIAYRKGSCAAAADWDRLTSTLTIYSAEVGDAFFEAPLSARALGLLIHELAHWTPREEEHGMSFHADSEDVGGAVAAWLVANAEEARKLAGGEGGEK